MTVEDSRFPYPLDWPEQDKFFAQMPKHLANMSLFKGNSGCRESEVCGLVWDWEVEVPGLDVAVFVIPAHTTLTARSKHGKNRWKKGKEGLNFNHPVLQ
ncbi:MAG: hypothetical protein AAF387_14625 [Pseudomonadota bacterium]